MKHDYDKIFRACPDPDIAAIRLEQLAGTPEVGRYLEHSPGKNVELFIKLISLSDFLFRYLNRHPDLVMQLDSTRSIESGQLQSMNDLSGLRKFKYSTLLQITWKDLQNLHTYEEILSHLSILADCIVNRVLKIKSVRYEDSIASSVPFCVFAMGKLGASELNYSSDVDLIFVCRDRDEYTGDYHEYQGNVIEHIRKFSQAMQENDEDGFLYRVDLKLRPWGRSGPLVMSVDETEHYYEASNEAWERFAWLRARVIAGESSLGNDLLERLQPFIYLRSLSSDDLQRFVKIKNDMNLQRHKEGSWNVKLGDGGIRDIEFFIQMLQIVNASNHRELMITGTLGILQHLVKLGFLDTSEGLKIRASYLFLRRLENRLQMLDEQQVHQLPDDSNIRTKIACSLGYGSCEDKATIEKFNHELLQHRNIARNCFERILPGEQ